MVQGQAGVGQLANLPSFCNVNNTKGGFNWCPNALQIAYGTNSIVAANGGKGMTIAIVDAFHYKNVAADLAFFNNEMNVQRAQRLRWIA